MTCPSIGGFAAGIMAAWPVITSIPSEPVRVCPGGDGLAGKQAVIQGDRAVRLGCVLVFVAGGRYGLGLTQG